MQLRTEIVKLMEPQTTGYRGLEAAAERVEDYKQLAMLWKGTGEEKARLKFVDSLIKLVEDRRRILDAREAAHNARPDGPAHPGAAIGRDQKRTICISIRHMIRQIVRSEGHAIAATDQHNGP